MQKADLTFQTELEALKSVPEVFYDGPAGYIEKIGDEFAPFAGLRLVGHIVEALGTEVDPILRTVSRHI